MNVYQKRQRIGQQLAAVYAAEKRAADKLARVTKAWLMERSRVQRIEARLRAADRDVDAYEDQCIAESEAAKRNREPPLPFEPHND